MESAQFAPYVLFPVEFPWRRSMQRRTPGSNAVFGELPTRLLQPASRDDPAAKSYQTSRDILCGD
jgi:hypothetical protein